MIPDRNEKKHLHLKPIWGPFFYGCSVKNISSLRFCMQFCTNPKALILGCSRFGVQNALIKINIRRVIISRFKYLLKIS